MTAAAGIDDSIKRKRFRVSLKNDVRGLDLDLENEVKVRKSLNFNWPHLGHFSTQNQNV